MNTTTKRDLTTPAAISAELSRLRGMIQGKYPSVYLILNDGPKGHISIDHDMCAPGNTGRIGNGNGSTFAEMIDNAEIAIKNWQVTRHESVIRKMALAIIDCVDEHTECTETLLRRKGFSASDITEYRDRACVRASEMAGFAPFTVEPR